MVRSLAPALALLLSYAASPAASPEQRPFKGLRLEEALRILQSRGLQIVFSSEVVTPDMRVAGEPRAETSRKQLDELLEPHALVAERGPAAVIQIVRARNASGGDFATRPPPSGRPGMRREPPSTGAGLARSDATRFTDRVLVTGVETAQVGRGVSDVTFDARDLQAATSILQDDGLRAVHAMPQVTSEDDFRSEFSVRGSPYRQIGLVVDEVATPWLQHGVYGRRDAGSLSMFGSGIMERATLQAGPYLRRYDDALGAQLQLTLREGSRTAKHFSGSAGGVSAAFLGEGPIGADARGSWIVSLRNSYRSWPVKQMTRSDVSFAFTDAHAKVVYEITPTQQFDATVLGGRSVPDMVDDPLGLPDSGSDYAGLLTAGWRSALSSRSVIRQRLSVVGQDLLSPSEVGQPAVRSSNRALGYRGEAIYALFDGVLEAGVEVRRLSGVRAIERDVPGALLDRYGAAWWTRSSYVGFAKAAPRGVSFAGGVRASESTLVRKRAVAPWILGAWKFKSGWTVTASAGKSRQFPDLDAVRGSAEWSDLKPERAALVDVGIEQRMANGFRWRMTLHGRAESDVLRGPAPPPSGARGMVVDPLGLSPYRNALRGTSRGVDLFVARDSAARFSGWMAYTRAATRQRDISTQEAFWADFDRRHALNAAGLFRITPGTTAGIVFRAGSGVPLPGYFDVSAGRLFAGDRRNEIRLPAYVRLDTRVQHSFFSSRHRVTVFGEVLNVLNRANQGTAEGFIQPLTGEATGFTRPLLPRRASVGIAVDLSR